MLFFLDLFFNFFVSIYFYVYLFCDVPEHYQMTIQDPATNILEWMIDLYDLICFELIIVVSIIFVLLFNILFMPLHVDDYYVHNKVLIDLYTEKFNIEEYPFPFHYDSFRYSEDSFSHSTFLEVFWTIAPAILLVTIAYPSFNLLYALDEEFSYTEYAIKIIGHQWYWTYEFYHDNHQSCYDSYMVNAQDKTAMDKYFPLTTELKKSRFKISMKALRLLDVDNRLYVRSNSNIKLFITSADVLHSWAVPSFGIKVDACPGRLSTAYLTIRRSGIYYGQCSEICGINHGFMPIVVEAVIEPLSIAPAIDNGSITVVPPAQPEQAPKEEVGVAPAVVAGAGAGVAAASKGGAAVGAGSAAGAGASVVSGWWPFIIYSTGITVALVLGYYTCCYFSPLSVDSSVMSSPVLVSLPEISPVCSPEISPASSLVGSPVGSPNSIYSLS